LNYKKLPVPFFNSKREGTTASIDAALTTFKERDRVVDLDGWQKIEKEYLAVDKQ
jgi:hypothetical protein